MTKIVEKVKFAIILPSAVFLMATMEAHAESRDRSVFTNSFRDNWEVSFGAEFMSFYSNREEELGLSSNPFMRFRSTYGASAVIGKWFSPEIGLRTKGTGYWGRTIISSDPADNNCKFYAAHEQVMLNLNNLFAGYNPYRFWNLIPYAGVGFARNCTHNENSISLSAGMTNTFRISRQIKAYLDFGVNFAGENYSSEGVQNVAGRYRWYHAGLGLTFNLGRNIWSRHANRHNIVTYITPSTRFPSVDMTKAEYKKILADAKVPMGMVLVERGHMRMGIEDPDTLWGSQTPVRDISVDDFWMDRTEITNDQYHAFLNDIRDSLIAECLPMYGNDRNLAEQSLYIVNPVTGEKRLDASRFIYRFEVYDYEEEMKRKNRLNPTERILDTDIKADPDEVVMIQKDTAYIDTDGRIIRERISRPLTGSYDFLNTYIVNVYPDTTCWVNDFPNAINGTYAKYYFSHPDYKDYPVVGVTWEQANAYCAWRTERMKRVLGKDYADEQPFRLPTEAEWEYAARCHSVNEFPWEQEIAGYGKGTLFANFMPDGGNFTKDGNIITSRVGVYPSNLYGLYDMAGNVAEWTSTQYMAAGIEVMNTVNPQLKYNVSVDDPYRLKRKSVRGGSWKDSESHIRSAWRSAEYQNQPRSYIGFRCVRSLASTPSERAVIVEKGKAETGKRRGSRTQRRNNK